VNELDVFGKTLTPENGTFSIIIAVEPIFSAKTIGLVSITTVAVTVMFIF
jgi:hypothetical protein